MKTQKNSKYICDNCQFVSDNKNDYRRHLLTLKHKMETMETFKETEKIAFLNECDCGMKYVTRNGLWKHKKKCNLHESSKKEYNECNNIPEKDLLCKLVESTEIIKNKDDMIIDLQKQLIESLNKQQSNTIINHNNNTQNNNQFNLQMYLNETCSNAMNIDTFLKNITVTIENVVEIGEIGYSKGIGNLIAKHINGMKQTDKPIQTTDVKRGLSWIKNKNNEWVKDENLALGNNLIFLVGDKYFRKYNDGYKTIAEWRDGQSKIHDKVIKSIGEIASVVSTDDKSGYYSKIHKTIAESTVIKK